ncbi:MAG: hypothetical protein R3Y53_10115 [Bacillota bacterium]
MNILDVAILLFVLMESMNIIMLTFFPDSKIGNAIGVFNPWFSLKENESNELFAKYMVNWVASTKLIFIMLLLAIYFQGSESLKVVTMVVMIFSILAYFFRLHPTIKKLDALGEITPIGYSKILGLMITGFILMFAVALFCHLV